MNVGLIIGGRCVIAPSRLDLSKHGDQAFLSMARNGLMVSVDGRLSAPFVRAYDEKQGWAEVSQLDSRGNPAQTADGRWATMRVYGKVRAIPGINA